MLIASITTRPHTIMEICGGQTHSILKYGIDKLLPEQVQLLHGPGCPVCVTPIEIIDHAMQIALQKHIIFCSFGDMLRVPGSTDNLLTARAKGADVRIVYSPLDAVKIAANEPNKEVVFFAIGFETTAPANAMAVKVAANMGLKNFSIIVSQFLVPPAIAGLLDSPACVVQGFLAAGHVCTVMGYQEYEPLCAQYNIPIVVTGFEPVDIMQGIYRCVCQLEQGTAVVENQYARVVHREGNSIAKQLIRDYFTVATKEWRGIGAIHNSGLVLRDEYKQFDAEYRFSHINVNHVASLNANRLDCQACIAGQILQGIKKPTACKAFGTRCHPEQPLGAPMVSAEGVCSAYYRYKKQFIEV